MKKNPYVAGNPVGGGEAFVGRNDILKKVVRVLRSHDKNALVLYGQRRIGKTSVLQEFSARLPDKGPFRTVYFDLQDKAARPMEEVLTELAVQVTHVLGLPPLTPLGEGEVARTAFRDQFLSQALDHLPKKTSLILLFDEFDVLDNPGKDTAGSDFFPYLRDLLSFDPQRLQIIFVIGRRPGDLSSHTLSLFKGVELEPVSLLSQKETVTLVRLAEKNRTLYWTDEAVTSVYELTGGHPFLTQQLCQEVWDQAYQDNPKKLPIIKPAEVESAVPPTLSSASNALEWLWDGLPPAARVVSSILAATGPEAITQEDLVQHLQESGVRILVEELQEAPRVLREWDLIETTNEGHRFRVESLRRWIAERKPLDRVQKEMDRIQPLADNLFQAAEGFYRAGDLEEAIPPLRQAIGVNPNHSGANQLLAEILLAQGEVMEARKLLESLYEYNPRAARPRLVQALLAQAQDAEKEEQLVLYERVLQLEPNQREARRIWEQHGDEAQAADDLETALEAYRKADVPEKVEEVEVELRHRRLEAELQKIGQLEWQRKYQDALKLAQQLLQDYPEARDKLDVDTLERKTHLDDLYRQALVAVQAKDWPEAQDLLAKVVSLEPGYEEATRYLHLSVKSEDVTQLQTELEEERSNRQQAEMNYQGEIERLQEQLDAQSEARRQSEDRVERLQRQLESETEARQKAEAIARAENVQRLQGRLEAAKEAQQKAEDTAWSETEKLRQSEAEVKRLQSQLENEEKKRQYFEHRLEKVRDDRNKAEIAFENEKKDREKAEAILEREKKARERAENALYSARWEQVEATIRDTLQVLGAIFGAIWRVLTSPKLWGILLPIILIVTIGFLVVRAYEYLDSNFYDVFSTPPTNKKPVPAPQDGASTNLDFHGYPAESARIEWAKDTEVETCKIFPKIGASVDFMNGEDPYLLFNNFYNCPNYSSSCSFEIEELNQHPIRDVIVTYGCSKDVVITLVKGSD